MGYPTCLVGISTPTLYCTTVCPCLNNSLTNSLTQCTHCKSKSLPFYLPPWVKPKTKLCLSAKLAIIPSSALAVSTTVGRMSSQAKFFDSKTEEGHGELCALPAGPRTRGALILWISTWTNAWTQIPRWTT